VEEAGNKNYSKPRRVFLSKSSKPQRLFLSLRVQNPRDYSHHREFKNHVEVLCFASPRVIAKIIPVKKVQNRIKVLFSCKTAEI
jgi:hypothetical protein